MSRLLKHWKRQKHFLKIVSIEEVREYFDESGADVDGMSEEELEDASEVFALPDGRYLVVEA